MLPQRTQNLLSTDGFFQAGVSLCVLLLLLTVQPLSAADQPLAEVEVLSPAAKPLTATPEAMRNTLAAYLAIAFNQQPLGASASCCYFLNAPSVPEIEQPPADPYVLDEDLFKMYVVDDMPIASVEARGGEVLCYDLALAASRDADPAEIAKRAQRGVSLIHLRENPDLYRAKLVHIEGRLRIVDRFEPRATAKSQGVSNLFEAWVHDRRTGRFFVLILTELPPGIQLGEKIDWAVTFNGYFFKRYAYRAANGETLTVPLLIGRTITIPNSRSEASE